MKERIVRDPIHDFVSISDYEFVQKLIDTEYFQRLRRLYQLGVSVYVYPSATHNRLSHSLGAMELFGRIFDNLHKTGEEKTKEELDEISKLRKIGISTMLLHDIGHGPLSHVSERIFGFKHEDITAEIIQKTEIKDILDTEGIDAGDVIKIIKHSPPPQYKYISQLVSSQLDADRLDYLTRDAYFTGVQFKIDLQRIIRTLQIYEGGGEINGYVVSAHKGLQAIESYVLSRHLMYQGVYFHKTTRGFERLIESVFRRAIFLAKNSKMALPKEFEFLNNANGFSINDLVQLDDNTVYYFIRQWTKSDDNTLKDLATRIINRNPLKLVETEKFMKYVDNLEKIKAVLTDKGFEPEYYLLHDDPTETPYSPYSPKGAEDETNVITNIFVLDRENKPREISQLSKVVKTLAEDQSIFSIYLPEECKSQTLSILGSDGK